GGDQRPPARMTAGCDIRQALKRLCQHRSTPMPEALAAEVAAGQVLGEGERPDGDAAHDRPVRDPGLRLLRGLDGYGGGGTAARAHAAPERRSAQAAEDAGHAGERLYGVPERGPP